MDIGFPELHTVDKPFDGGRIPFDGIYMPGRRIGYISAPTIVSVSVIIPVYVAVGCSFPVDMFHNVYFAAVGPGDTREIGAQHPEGRPQALSHWYGNPRFNFSVFKLPFVLGCYTGRGVIAPPIAF